MNLGVFNDLSLVFKGEFDIIASITYTLVVVRGHIFGPSDDHE